MLPPSAASGGLPVLVTVDGDRNFKSEDVIAYETGYRVRLTHALSFDVAAFYNPSVYSHLLSAEPATPFLNTTTENINITAPLIAANLMSGTTYGAEFLTEWKPTSAIKFQGSYTFLRMDVHRDPGSLDTTSPDPAGESPRHQFYVRSSLDLSKTLKPDVTLRYVDSLTGLDVPSYYSLDASLGWTPTSHLELSITAQNLTDDQHLEFRPDFIETTPTLVKRTYQAMLRWKF